MAVSIKASVRRYAVAGVPVAVRPRRDHCIKNLGNVRLVFRQPEGAPLSGASWREKETSSQFAGE